MNNRWDETQAASLADDLEELVYLSQLVGRDPTLTQPGGGNTSVKRRETDIFGRSVDVLRVKGSGTDLATMTRAGFTGLRAQDLDTLRGRVHMSDEDMMALMRACMLDVREAAPSVETPLHAVLPHRFVVHTHDFATQALTDTPRPAHWVAEALGDEVVYVDYARPGFRSRSRSSIRGVSARTRAAWCWDDTVSSPGETPRAIATPTCVSSSTAPNPSWPLRPRRTGKTAAASRSRRRSPLPAVTISRAMRCRSCASTWAALTASAR